MSCPKTQTLMQEYFSDDLAEITREELDHHLAECEICNAELESVLLAQSNLHQWQDQSVPHWDRGLQLFRQEHRASRPERGFWNSWQWLPTAASFAMLFVLLMNVSVVSGEQGVSISFGGGSSSDQQLQGQLASFEEEQSTEMNDFITRMEARQDNNNVLLMQAVMDQTQQSTAENFEQMYSYFDQQRLMDLEGMRASYQQLVDSDYETIRSLQDLVNYVGYTSSGQ